MTHKKITEVINEMGITPLKISQVTKQSRFTVYPKLNPTSERKFSDVEINEIKEHILKTAKKLK